MSDSKITDLPAVTSIAATDILLAVDLANNRDVKITEQYFEAGLHLNNQLDTLTIAKGGTGQATANAGLNALLPTQASNIGKVLGTDGANTSWINAIPPTGSITIFSTSSAPAGWLICDGSAISRTTYNLLFALIGTSYGIGDNSTTFNVPNLKGKAVVGYDASQTEFNTIGKTGGEKTHILTTTEMPSHNHPLTGLNTVGGVNGSGYYELGAFNYNSVASVIPLNPAQYTASTGSDGAHNNLQPYISLNYIIKT